MVRKSFVWLFSICMLCAFLTVSCGGGSESAIETWTGNRDYVSPKHTLASEAKNQSTGLEDRWWESTTFYHIWVRSFADSDGDRCGDLRGITDNVWYIEALGCRGIWLSPIFECDFKGTTVNMHGYDVSDYYAVNSLFGTEQDVIDLINACHARNIKVIFDFVPNHSGKGNQWFKDSIANKDGKRDWYVWNSTALNWNTGMGLSGWTRNGNEYYWHAFADSQPDLNFRNYEVREEMKNVVRYWLNRGFDGLRIDAVRYLIENDSVQVDTAESIDFFKELRTELDQYESPKFMTFEAWITNDRKTLNTYFGSQSEPAANMLLDFDQGSGIVSAINASKASALKNTLFTSENNGGGGYGTFLANHDEYMPRLGTLFEGGSAGEAKIDLATALSLLRPTTPFVYYGQEIAMEEDTSYGTSDIRLRMPFDWYKAEIQMRYDTSIYSMNKELIHFRNKLPGLFSSSGKVKFLESKQQYDGRKVDKVAAYTISDGNDVLLCISNLSKYQWDSYSFAIDAETMKPDRQYTLVMAYENKDNFSVNSESIEVKNLYPYEMRLYYSGSTIPEPSMIFTESDLLKGEQFAGEDYLGEEVSPEKAFYLRGDMNGWNTSLPMGCDSSEKLWKAKVSLMRDTYDFKLDKGGEWQNAYGYDKKNMPTAVVKFDTETKIYTAEGNGTNLSFTAPSAGEYIFSFNESTQILKITRASS